MLHNLDLVALSVTLPEHGLVPGALGTIIEVFTDPKEAYRVEFGASDGAVAPFVRLGPDQVHKLGF